MIKLSILVPTVHTRYKSFLPNILEQLYTQYDKLEDKEQVEILVLSDTKTIMLGEKRNIMVDLAQGEYVVHVDDDDRLHPEYIQTLLNAINETDVDVITFLAEVTINGKNKKICDYSVYHGKDYNMHNEYRRLPNHICCVRKSVADKVSFPNIMYGEDKLYAELLKNHIETEHQIKEVLYFYDYNEKTSETQEFMPQKRMYKHDKAAVVDIVILSKATNATLKNMTQKAVDTAIKAANGISVNVFVVEQVAEVQYENAKTIYHDTGSDFCYNANLNLAAKEGQADWIIFSNNDIVFQDSYLHHLLAANHPVVSTHCPKDPRQADITENTLGNINGKHFSGWCFMMSRELWEKIGGLSEEFKFWYSDDITIWQVNQAGYTPMIVKKAIAHHLGSTTFKELSPSKKDEYTWEMTEKFNNISGQNKFADNPYYKEWLRKKKSQ